MSDLLTIPEQFGRYLLVRRVALGGMAEIFLARQQGPGRFERSLILKRILPHLAEDARFVEMFKDEAALVAQLSHPNIAQVLDFGREGEHYYIALELVRGPDLGRILDSCTRLNFQIPIAVSLRIAIDALGALDYAHRAADEAGAQMRIVHRDVTPTNIGVTMDGVVKLLDFGIAKAATASHLTEAGIIKGKFRYMAPEQMSGKQLDGRTDEYACALVLYEMLTLVPVWRSNGSIVQARLPRAEVTPIGNLRAELPPALQVAIARALQVDPGERFASCREFQLALEEVHRSLPERADAHAVGEWLQSLDQALGGGLSRVGPASPEGPLLAAVEPTVVESATLPSQTVEVPPSSGRSRRIFVVPLVALFAVGAWFASQAVLSPAPPKPVVGTEPAPPLSPPSERVDAEPPRLAPAQHPQVAPPREPARAPAIAQASQASEAAHEAKAPSEPRHEHRTRPAARAVSQAAASAPPAAVVEAPPREGSLVFAVNPWADVTLDGKDLGQTPVSPAKLTPGRHHVVLRNSSLGKVFQEEVVIIAGQPYTLKYDFMREQR